MTATSSTSHIVYSRLGVKNWIEAPPGVEAVRPGICPGCRAASRPAGARLGLHGHGLRDRQIRGPTDVATPSTTIVVACRRYRCVHCGAIITVVPTGVEPRRHYGRAAICLALALWALAEQPTAAVRRRVCAWTGSDATSWRTLRRWALAAATGTFAWCRGAVGQAPRVAAARAAQIAASRAPPPASGPVWEQAYAGGASLA